MDASPPNLIKPPSVDEKTVPVVTEKHMRNLLMPVDPALARTPAHRFRLVRSRALLYMLWDTPRRMGEISKLRLEDIDMEAGAVLVMGKGRRERWMPPGDAARSVLQDYLLEGKILHPMNRALWVAEEGVALLPNGIFRILKRLGKRAGISNLHTHRFRHSYAVNALRAGMPERVLEIVGGWKKIPPTYSRTLELQRRLVRHDDPLFGEGLGRWGRKIDAAVFEQVYEASQGFHAYFGPLFGRRESREHGLHYLQALLVQTGERRNAENLSETVPVSARAMQRFLTESPWDDEAVMGRLQEYLAPRLEHPEAIWVLDGSDFPKQGRKSVGVARQYCGRLGKVANCQAGMFLGLHQPAGPRVGGQAAVSAGELDFRP